MRPHVHEIVLHHDSPALIGDDDDASVRAFLSNRMRETQPRLDSNFGVAAERARMAAPSVEDEGEWRGLLVALMDDGDDEWGEAQNSGRPRPVGYVYALRFWLDGLQIEATEDLDRKAHLAFREENPDVDLLWLPSVEQGPLTNAIRVITHRDLSDHFEVIRATPIEGWSRPPQES